jgi:hypothetical protein
VDVLALQEAPGSEVCSAVPEGFELVDSFESHAGFVQLYCRTGLKMKRAKRVRGVPAVVGACVVNDKEVFFVSAHLWAHADGMGDRRQQVQKIKEALEGKHFVMAGDMNVYRRDREAEGLCEDFGLQDVRYSGNSWAPKSNPFFSNLLAQPASERSKGEWF